jgi:integrase
MKFPQLIGYRGQKARIYGRSENYPFYRVAYRAHGKRVMRTFSSYAEAKEQAEKKVRELHRGDWNAALSPKQAEEALAAFKELETFRHESGRSYSLLRVVTDFCGAVKGLDGVTLTDALEAYRNTVAMVRRMDLAKAVEEFIESEAFKTKAKDGGRAQMSEKYAYNRAILLRRFVGTFPNTAVSELGKAHLDKFVESLEKEFSPKSRNHHRAAVKTFLTWAVAKDYLPHTHRLFEANKMKPETANEEDIEFYTAKEFRALLESSEGSMQAAIAIQGLAGLRAAEVLRLNWEDIWRISGQIEITAMKSKTRQRRLVTVCDALGGWLEPYRKCTGSVWVSPARNGAHSREVDFQQRLLAVCEKAGLQRKRNGLRHGFCSHHFALHNNENLTAKEAGHTPAMLHRHYNGLATSHDAEAWFAVRPAKGAGNIIALPLANEAS